MWKRALFQGFKVHNKLYNKTSIKSRNWSIRIFLQSNENEWKYENTAQQDTNKQITDEANNNEHNEK